MSVFKKLIKKICARQSTPKTTLIEVRRGGRYVLIMEVPADLTMAEQIVLQNAASDLRGVLNHWLSSTDEPFMTILTIDGMPIRVEEVRDGEN